jgi:hypothetical protein
MQFPSTGRLANSFRTIAIPVVIIILVIVAGPA